MTMFKKVLFLFLVAIARLQSAEVTPEMEYQMLSTLEIMENKNFPDDPYHLASHFLAGICSEQDKIVLTDGSVWEVGFFWRNRLACWCQNDELRFSLYPTNPFNIVKIENLNQHSVVWGNALLRPDIETVDVRWIVDTYLDSLVELNDGAVYKTKQNISLIQSNWGPENIVFILSSDHPEYPFNLWNMTWNTVAPFYLFSPPGNSN